MPMDQKPAFTEDEREFLMKFNDKARLDDERQNIDMMGYASKYEFARVCKVYRDDWETTREQVLSQKESPGGLRREVVEEMAAIGDGIMEDKLLILGIHFKNTWHESLVDYIGNGYTDTLEAHMKK
jgi:hypothetical protein